MLGGILVGLIEIFVKLFAPGWYEAVTYGTLIVILLVKPSASWQEHRRKSVRRKPR